MLYTASILVVASYFEMAANNFSLCLEQGLANHSPVYEKEYGTRDSMWYTQLDLLSGPLPNSLLNPDLGEEDPTTFTLISSTSTDIQLLALSEAIRNAEWVCIIFPGFLVNGDIETMNQGALGNVALCAAGSLAVKGITGWLPQGPQGPAPSGTGGENSPSFALSLRFCVVWD